MPITAKEIAERICKEGKIYDAEGIVTQIVEATHVVELIEALEAASSFVPHLASREDRYSCDPTECPKHLIDAALDLLKERHDH